MIKIPTQLQNENFRFIKLEKQSKLPVKGMKWLENLHKFNDKELLDWLEEDGNYGVVAGYGNIRILDIDDLKLAEEMIKKINTFIIKTPGGGYHFYFISEYNKNHILKDGKGEFRANNLYVVGPNCFAIDNKKNHTGGYKTINEGIIKG